MLHACTVKFDVMENFEFFFLDFGWPKQGLIRSFSWTLDQAERRRVNDGAVYLEAHDVSGLFETWI